jgi:hypothetical protein
MTSKSQEPGKIVMKKSTKERNKKRKSSKTKGDEKQLGREGHESHQEHLRKGRGQNELQRIAVECKKATLCVLQDGEEHKTQEEKRRQEEKKLESTKEKTCTRRAVG